MRLEWDWLGPLVSVPFVPTIRPVHPDAIFANLFSDVIDVAGTDRFLTYDKDSRWSDAKTETVLVEDIFQGPHETLFPVLSRRKAGSVSVYIYGARPESRDVAKRLASRLCSVHRAATARIVWFGGCEDDAVAGTQMTRVHIHEFRSKQRAAAPTTVGLLEECADTVKATFVSFATTMATEGFGFLYRRMAAGNIGPVLVAVDDASIVGAIGPMEIMTDSNGNARLLPPYFGVLADWRGQGHGRALWRAAMQWGHRHGAAYQLVQTEVGAASDHICRTEGLRALGLVYRATV